MTRRLASLAQLLLLLLACGAATAQEPRALSAAEVLASSEQHFPEILQSIAALRGAAGRRIAAEGAFDLVFEADGRSRLDGFYDGEYISGTARQPFRPLGAEVYGGYELSNGTFPIYEDEYYTNTGGALKVGVLFSLLRDRDIDRRRFNESDALLGISEARLDVVLTKIGVQQRALRSYWQWVKVGRQLDVYRNLHRIAVERQGGLEEQVRQGAMAEIFLVENRQNITRRQSLVTSADRSLRLAANALSYYYRDEQGRPVSPDESRLPVSNGVEDHSELTVLPQVAVSDAVDRRPELAILEAAIERARMKIDLSENELKPRLELGLEVKQGLGSIAEGGPSRDSTDTIIGLQFSVPLQRRTARGEIMQAQAEMEVQQAERQLREEQIEIEVRNILLQFRYARELLLLAEQEVQQSETMRLSELQRFESGASDFFLVNLREEQAANARVRFLEAELETRLARADYDAAVVDLKRLGISESALAR